MLSAFTTILRLWLPISEIIKSGFIDNEMSFALLFTIIGRLSADPPVLYTSYVKAQPLGFVIEYRPIGILHIVSV